MSSGNGRFAYDVRLVNNGAKSGYHKQQTILTDTLVKKVAVTVTELIPTFCSLKI